MIGPAAMALWSTRAVRRRVLTPEDAGSSHRGALVAFISRVSMLGLVLGVALLIVVLSVMNGFDRELRERILSLVPHVSLQPIEPVADWRPLAAAVEAHPEVVAAAPYVDLQGLLMYRGKVVPALLHGADAAAERRISAIDRYLESGSLDALAEPDTVLLSRALAQRLGVAPGASLLVLVPELGPSDDKVRGRFAFEAATASP